MSERRARISSQESLPVARQCELLDVSRSTANYHPQPVGEADLALMAEIDRIDLERPFYGSRRVRDELADRGFELVDRKRVQRPMATMGLATGPKRAIGDGALGFWEALEKVYPGTRAVLLAPQNGQCAQQAAPAQPAQGQIGAAVDLDGGDAGHC